MLICSDNPMLINTTSKINIHANIKINPKTDASMNSISSNLIPYINIMKKIYNEIVWWIVSIMVVVPVVSVKWSVRVTTKCLRLAAHLALTLLTTLRRSLLSLLSC